MNITQLKQGSLNGLRKQTNECLENAYRKGYEDGKLGFRVSNGQAAYNKGYNKGLEEFENLYINEHDYKDFFKSYDNEDIQNWELYDLIAKYGAKKIIDDFKNWQEEKKQAEEEIKVGDIVINKHNKIKGVVYKVEDGFIYGTNDYLNYFLCDMNSCKRIGHFDEVEQLLDKLRSGREEWK